MYVYIYIFVYMCGRDLKHNATSLLPNPLFWKLEDGRAVATATAGGTTTILLSKFPKMGCTMLGDEIHGIS